MSTIDYICWYIWKRLYIKIIDWHLKLGKSKFQKALAWQLNLKWWRFYRSHWYSYEPMSH